MDELEIVKNKFKDINDNELSKKTEILINDFFKKVINNKSNDYKQIITKNKELIENLVKSFEINSEKSNEIKNLKEFIFTLILDKCIYLSYINGNTRRKEYIEKSGYNTINKYNEYYNDLLNLSDSFGINLDEFCKKIQKEKDEIQNLLKEQSLDENLINDILPENYKEFYNEFKQITNKKTIALYITTDKNRQNYIKYYIEINNPKSEFYIEDVKIRKNFLSKFQTLMEYMQPIDDKTLAKALNNPKHIADLSYNDNEILLIFAQNLPETEDEIKQFKDNFNKIYNNVFKRKQGRVKDYINHRLGLFKYLIKNKKLAKESKVIIEEFKKIQEKIKDIKNSDVVEQIIGMFDEKSDSYIKDIQEINKILEEIFDKFIKNKNIVNKTQVGQYILNKKGLVPFPYENTNGFELKIINGIKYINKQTLEEFSINTAKNLLKDNGYSEVVKKINSGEYKIVPNEEGGNTENKFKIIDITSNKPVYYFKFLDTFKQSDFVGRVPNKQLHLGNITDLIQKAKLKYFTTCGMKVIQNSQNQSFNLVIAEAAKSPTGLVNKYYHKRNPEDLLDTEYKKKALNGENNIIIGTLKNNKDPNLHDLLASKDTQFQIDFIKGAFESIATCAIFDLIDFRSNGNILINEEKATWQGIDFETVDNLTIGEANSNVKFTHPKERECLKDRLIAQDIAELTINSYASYFYACDGLALSLDEILTGNSVINGEKVKFSIPDTINKLEKEIEELKKNEEITVINGKSKEEIIKEKQNFIVELKDLKDNYKTHIANTMINLAESIDNEIEKLLEKEKLEKKEEEKLAFLIERRVNVMVVFKNTEIGKRADELYTAKHGGHSIEDLGFTFSETELQPIQISESIEESKDYEFAEKSTNMLQSNEQLHKRMIECKSAIMEKYNKLLELKNSKQK